ncbi:r.Pab1 restriction endonuclease [Helicobacter pylori GAM83Bi]|nr:r.Pab1 restriction endonuclease [Helicobacter pylori GAM83Bi]EMH39012.1 r.Pab1 restriction endonuclease [Helicobacter pylori GAM83T]
MALKPKPCCIFAFLFWSKTATPLLDRTAALKEHALLTIHKTNAPMFLEMLKIFGLLSQAHHNDVLKILEKILQN